MNKRLAVCTLNLFSFLSFFLISSFSFANNSSNNSTVDNNTPLRIAVSANFSPVLAKLIPIFKRDFGIRTEIISGSSGTLYQQIIHGAPFDIFLSADDIHPQRLASENFIVKNSLHTYAIGQLAFWSANDKLQPEQSLSAVLLNKLNSTNSSTRIAIANPNTAPYGQRAFETLKSLQLWDSFQSKLIIGINVNQTFQQIRSHAVNAGFVALSQLKLNGLQGIIVPEQLYTRINQQLVILKNSKKIADAKQLSNFLQRLDIQNHIAELGYKKISHLENTSPENSL